MREIAQILLRNRLKEDAYISQQWVKRFINGQPNLKSKITRKYNYQRAKCEDLKIIKA